MKTAEVLNMTSQLDIVGNEHTIQAFCDVINDADNLCRCQLQVISGLNDNGQCMKIGDIVHAIRREDIGQNVVTVSVKLTPNFYSNFMPKPGAFPELHLKVTPQGLVTRMVLMKWNTVFENRKNKKF